MTLRMSAGMTLFAATIVTASVVGTRQMGWPSPRPSISAEPSPIESLDERIQWRLHGHEGNGMMRLIHPLLHRDQFNPETPAEKKVIEDLQAAGWTVGLRLGARDLNMPSSSSVHRADPGLSLPIDITGRGFPVSLPTPDDLREVGCKALESSDWAGRGVESGSFGRWSVEARVVRADRQACISCHASREKPSSAAQAAAGRLKIGDAVGVAIYYYTRQRP